ncbi:hypothetical protein [Enterococcus faecium]|uniref:Uncharacterized protein n=1 Tax=Enterococcus faecium TaxID=1352 RepID=A0A2C9X4N1_ENTFC|nr:hypothetical protein [Enterococcus faecium]OTN82276.1 hypothetical protein A5810_003197 [Enterococcus faecium]
MKKNRKNIKLLKIWEEYKITRNKEEDFLYWLIIRKLNIFEKIVVALILWGVWLKYAFDLVFMVKFLEVIFLVGIIYWLVDIFLRIKNRLVRYVRKNDEDKKI